MLELDSEFSRYVQIPKSAFWSFPWPYRLRAMGIISHVYVVMIWLNFRLEQDLVPCEISFAIHIGRRRTLELLVHHA
jgi:hypothetical protein